MYWLDAELPPDIPRACVVKAANHFSLPTAALVAVLRQEGGRVGRADVRSHGVYYGPFQVSNKWLPELGKWGYTATHLQNDACSNVIAGAYVLAYYKARESDWGRAFARYNVGSLDTPKRREAGFRYARSVIQHWHGLHSRWGV